MSRMEVAANRGHSPRLPDASLRALGAPVGLQLAEVTMRVQKLLALREIRDTKAYKAAGHTWESYCREFIGASSNAVEEDLSNITVLGEQLYAAAQLAGITRGDYRVLRALPPEDLPRLLPSGEILIGERPIPVDADHKAELTEAIKTLVSELNYTRNAREDAETALAERTKQLEKEQAAGAKLGAQLSERREIEQEAKRFQELRTAATGDVTHGILLVGGVLVQLKDRCEEENPDRAEVLSAARVLVPLVQALIHYGAGRRAMEDVAPDLDLDALDAVLSEHAAEERLLDGDMEEEQ